MKFQHWKIKKNVNFILKIYLFQSTSKIVKKILPFWYW